MGLMTWSSVLWAVTVLLVLCEGPSGAVGRALDTPAAAGPDQVASVLPGFDPAAVEVQNTPLSRATSPAPSKFVSSVSSRKGPTTFPPSSSVTLKTFDRTVKQLPTDTSLLTAGDLQSQYTGSRRPQLFRGRSVDFKPQANGVGGIPYSDSRFTADYVTLAQTRVGRLFMLYEEDSQFVWYACTASVINRALLVTAAHCVCQWGLGQNCLPVKDANGNLQVLFDLGRDITVPPGQPGFDPNDPNYWSAAGILVPPSYAFGTDSAVVSGIVTNNDLALVWLNPKNGTEVGDVGEWFSYAVNGWGFSAPSVMMGFGAPTAPASSQVTVLGYPGAFDRGNRMQISNSAAYNMQFGGMKRNPRAVKNLIRGSSYTPGSSGAAWVANYGIDANIRTDDNGVPLGQYGPFNAERNVILGVVSWGYRYTSELEAPQVEGASMFATNKEFPASTYGTRGPGNIGKLMFDACDNPALPEWQLKSKGLCQ